MRIDFSQFDALIFDMDGTLVDSMVLWRYGIWMEYMLSLGVSLRVEDIEMITKRGSGRYVAEVAEREGIKLGTWDEIYDDLNVLMEPHYLNLIPCKPNVPEFLEKMHSTGIRMCVATSTREPVARKALAAKGIDKYFEFVTGDRELHVGKSSPEYFHRVAEKLGVAPERCLIFEDAAYSIRAAKAGGMKVLAVKDEMAVKDMEEIKEISDWYIDGYSELL